MVSLNVIIIWSILKITVALIVSKTINKTREKDTLLEFHLQLYRNHCGDVVFCDNVTDHVGRLDFSMPVPCCLPCSCSPTCGIQQNCCPGFGYHTINATCIESRRGVLQPNHANLSTNEDTAVKQRLDNFEAGNKSRPVNLTKNGINQLPRTRV